MNVVNHFVPLSYAVYYFDHIGHGKSEGMREVVERFTDYKSVPALPGTEIYHLWMDSI
jgi:alpha-beta hydrolase superfamily lysophospholipase